MRGSLPNQELDVSDDFAEFLGGSKRWHLPLLPEEVEAVQCALQEVGSVVRIRVEQSMRLERYRRFAASDRTGAFIAESRLGMDVHDENVRRAAGGALRG